MVPHVPGASRSSSSALALRQASMTAKFAQRFCRKRFANTGLPVEVSRGVLSRFVYTACHGAYFCSAVARLILAVSGCRASSSPIDFDPPGCSGLANCSTVARAAAGLSAGVLPSVTMSKWPAPTWPALVAPSRRWLRISSGVGRPGKPSPPDICGMIPSWRNALATLLGRGHAATAQMGIPGRCTEGGRSDTRSGGSGCRRRGPAHRSRPARRISRLSSSNSALAAQARLLPDPGEGFVIERAHTDGHE